MVLTTAGVPGRIEDRAFRLSLESSLARVERIDPAPLAELFTLAGATGEQATTVREALHQFLLDRTLDHAVKHTAFYRRQPYRDRPRGPDGRLADVDGLPVLRREQVLEHFEDFIADDVVLRSVCHTSGTTGRPLDLYKSYEEIAFLQSYYSALTRRLTETLTSRPLVLAFPNVNHGVPVPMPSVGLTFVGGVTDDTLIRDAERVLRHRFHRPGYDARISILTGLPHHVLLFTSYLIEQGIDPRDLGLRSVTITGGYLGMNWIEFLQEAWGCIVNDRFTLTEAVGGASRLPGSNVYELDPHLVGEVIDPDTNRRTDMAVGLLALTNLHPFVQMQPLIRYTVGDVVRRVPSPGPMRFQFLGKEANCISWIRDGRREWLLFSARLNDLLCALPDVNVYEWFSNVRVVHDRTVGSLPIMSVTGETLGDRLALRVALELRYAPHTRRAHVDGIRRAIVAGLRASEDTALAKRMDEGLVNVDVEFFGPGALKAPIVIKI